MWRCGGFEIGMSKFGVLVAWTNNVGDEIQTLASASLLPRVDCFLDRDRPVAVEFCGVVKVIFNGWFTYRWRDWLPSDNVVPLFISFHLAPEFSEAFLGRGEVRRYLSRYGPVGARDLYTLAIMKRWGVESYFSGCITLTLGVSMRRLKRRSRGGYLLTAFQSPFFSKRVVDILGRRFDVVNVPYHQYGFSLWRLPIFGVWKYFGLNPSALEEVLYWLDYPVARSVGLYRRFYSALLQLGLIANADLVITSRLHVALPAVGFGVPVIFVHDNLRDPRFWGLLDFVNPITPRKFLEMLESGFRVDGWEVRNWERLEELRSDLVARVRDFVNS